MDKYLIEQEEDEYIDLKALFVHIIQGTRKFWWIIPITVLLCMVAGYGYQKSKYVPMYQAKGIFTVSTKLSDELGDGDASYEFYYNKRTASQMAVTFPYILQSEVFQQVLQKELGTEYINGDLSVEAIPDTNLFTVVVTSESAEDAYKIVEAVMANYPDVAKYVIGDTKLTVLETPTKPVNPYTSFGGKRMLLKLGLIGFVLGLLPIGVYAITRKQIHSREDIKEYLNMECLGIIGKVSKKKRSKKTNALISIEDRRADAGFVKAIKRFSYRLARKMEDGGDHVVLITSTNPNEGKSMTAYNLSKEFATHGKRVVLVHGDIRKYQEVMHTDKKEQFDLKKFLEDPKDMVAKLEEQRDSFGVIELRMIEETQNPMKLLHSKAMKEVIEELKEAGEYVVIDSPPVGLMADAMLLSTYADGVVYVVRQDYMNRGQILNGIAALSAEDNKIYGCLLNYSTEQTLSKYGRYEAYEVQPEE